MPALLLDTHAVVWYLSDDARLSSGASTAIDSAVHEGNALYLSAITLVEITYLVEKGRLPDECKGRPPCRVIVVFEPPEDDSRQQWLEVQEQALATAWDDEEDGVYDRR
mgnify:CR=1 FL=1